MKSIKTNALRILDREKIEYKIYQYDTEDGLLDAVSVAKKTNTEPTRLFKTLVVQSGPAVYHVCIIPSAEDLDLKKAARSFNAKKIEMIPAKDITKVTGYVKGGCSPVGMKKSYPTAMHFSAAEYDFVVVSAGKIGLQMELKAKALMEIVQGQFVDLIKD